MGFTVTPEMIIHATHTHSKPYLRPPYIHDKLHSAQWTQPSPPKRHNNAIFPQVVWLPHMHDKLHSAWCMVALDKFLLKF